MQNTNINVSQIKKSFMPIYEALIAAGADKKLKNDFVAIVELMYAKTNVSNGKREFTILRDNDKNILARKCSFTGRWALQIHFFAGSSILKIVEKYKAQNYNAGKKIENEAKTILDNARNAVDANEKLSLFEQYDNEMLRARDVINATIELSEEDKNAIADISFDNIEDLLNANEELRQFYNIANDENETNE